MTPTEQCARITRSEFWRIWMPLLSAVGGAVIAAAVAYGGRQLDEAREAGELHNRVAELEQEVSRVRSNNQQRTQLLRSIDQRLSRIEGRLGKQLNSSHQQ